MERKPFEIIAECEIAGFPTGVDIERVAAHIEKARHARPHVVQVAVTPPAIFRERRYVLQTRFTVWAEDAMSAADAVEDLLRGARVPCRTVIPSGRALAAPSVPSPSRTAKSNTPTPHRPKSRASSKVSATKKGPRAAKGAPRRRRRS